MTVTKVSIQYKKKFQKRTNLFFDLHLALPGVVETLAVPSSK